ncbi:MAG: hypothetical protein K1X74_16990 [Pirellulales bacterium]|nr:hypothetical protein [Pirellulales bacterium]
MSSARDPRSNGGGMPPVELFPVRTRRDRAAFIDLPWAIYRDDPQWVPPLKYEVSQFISRKHHPFYAHGEAEIFLARRAGVPVGRILVSDDPRYNEQHGTNLGCFGMFECIDDVHVARALIEQATNWLRARGRTAVMGPIDYSTNYPCGLLIEGFSTPPRVMMNHHRPYYAALLEACGLSKAKDTFAWWFEDPHDMVAAWREKAQKITARFGVTVRNIRMNDFDNEMARCKQLYNEAWSTAWGFVKMTDVEFEHLGKSLKLIAVPEMVKIAEVEGRPVGITITLPDINEAIRPLNGRLTNWGLPINLVRFLWNQRKIKAGRLCVLGVLEGFRRRGVPEMMILDTLDYGKNQLKYTGAELGWTLEDNDLINRLIERTGAQKYKRYRIFEASWA